MIYSIYDIQKMIFDYFFSDKNNTLEEAISNQRQLFAKSLGVFIEENFQYLKSHLPKIIELLQILHPEEGSTSDAKAIVYFIDQLLDDNSTIVYENPYSIIKLFTVDEHLSNSLKNLYMYRIADHIHFAKMQRESLRNTSAYNRHIAKSLTEMRNTINILFELQVSYSEIKGVLEKYYEFNRHVNTEHCWDDFFSLKGYQVFDQFLLDNQINEKDHLSIDFE